MCSGQRHTAGATVPPAPLHQDMRTGTETGGVQALADSSICQLSAAFDQALGGREWRDSEAGTKGTEGVG